MNKTIYLAGPIQGRSDVECIHWRNVFTEIWKQRGYDVLNPMTRDYRPFEHIEDRILARQIVEEDLKDISMSDGLVVFFDMPSVGTSMEIVYANMMGKPIVVVNASGKVVSPWLLHHTTAIVSSLKEAANYLEGMIV